MQKNRIIVYAGILAAGIAMGVLLTTLARATGSASPHTQSDTSERATSAASEAAGHDHDHAHGSGAEGDWCEEHRVPESGCTRCHPELAAHFREKGDWCGEHDLPESHCRKCNPELAFPQEPVPSDTEAPRLATSVFFPPNRAGCASEQAVIEFNSAETASRIGLTVEPALQSAAATLVEAPAEVVFDETRTRAVTTTVPATILQWRVEPGTNVRAGDVLAELESPEVVQLQAEYVEAFADWALDKHRFQRSKDLLDRHLISEAEYQETEAHVQATGSKVESAAGRLRSAGVGEEEIAALQVDRQISSRWLLRAPATGIVLERRAPLGELLAAGSTLALLGQPEALWIEAHVREHDLPGFKVGQKLEFTGDGGELARAAAEVIWVAQYLDPRTRTGLVRAKVISGQDKLKAHLFGRVRTVKESEEQSLLVSKDAVQWEGCCHIVFVQESDYRYRPRKVTIDRGDRERYRVTSGLAAGELVVSGGSFLLKSELKKGSLGAGCAGE